MPESRHAGGLDDADRTGTIFGQEKIIITHNLARGNRLVHTG